MRHRLVALGAWVVLIVAAQVAIQRSGKGTVEALSDAVEVARGAWWALPAYLAAYAARSLVMFPAVLLTVAAGVLFGAWLGMPIALLGAVISAAISYEIARTIGPTEATLNRPTLATVDTATKEPGVSFKERTDVTAVPALGVVVETMVALVLAQEATRKFGGDSLAELVRNHLASVAALAAGPVGA